MMSPTYFLVIAFAYLAPGAAALVIRAPRMSRIVGFAGAAAASCLGLVLTAVGALRGEPLRIPMPAPVPWAASELYVDGLAAFFLGIIFLVGFLSSLYALGYMREYDDHGGHSGKAAPLFFNLLILCMAFVVASGDMLSFLLGWEGMSLASYFLVVFEHEKADARRAGLIYLIATHIGTGGILMAFLLLVRQTGSFSFDAFTQVPLADTTTQAVVFGFALLGFGTKAGMFPFHIWLPHAHPAAPSPVSALMSGVMIKMGIYGIVRFLFYLLPAPPLSFGAILAAFGLLSGIFGVLYAIAQHDLKRLLAFHSVENIGIILIGIGTASVCRSAGLENAAGLLFAGGLFHVLNHAIFKGLLFMGAGAVVQGTHTRNIEKMGGVMRAMPLTGLTFLVGSLAISAVPPLNGFASEFAIYRGLWEGARGGGTIATILLTSMAGLALIGGLAFACFVKVVGSVFLGASRTATPSGVADPGSAMAVPMAVAAILCAILGIVPFLPMDCVPRFAPFLSAGSTAALPTLFVDSRIVVAFAALLLSVGGLVLLRTVLLRQTGKRAGETWGCGFSYVTPRMQYTASSFADPILHVFRGLLRPRTTKEARVSGRFLLDMAYETRIRDLFENGVYLPIYRFFIRLAFLARRLHTGYIHVYLGYILGAVVLLLILFR